MRRSVCDSRVLPIPHSQYSSVTEANCAVEWEVQSRVLGDLHAPILPEKTAIFIPLLV